MKRLLLLRHAKSRWDEPRLDDFDRPLAPRGIAAAPRVAREMHRLGLLPDLVLCSTATRAVETWHLVARELPGERPVERLRDLYMASPAALLKRFRQAPDEADCLLAVGHNPGLEALALRLATPGSDREALARLRQKFPTAALTVFEVAAGSWADLGDGTARLTAFIRPRELE